MKKTDASYLNFKKEDLLLNSSDQETPYRRRKDEEKTSIAFGQRKLLLTLIQFLTTFWDPTKVKKPIVVYAGAAPGHNISIVSQLFPEVEFHLYDPRPFKIKSSESIFLYNQFFTDEDASSWSGRDDIYFVSDIRTADYTQARDLNQNEEQILKDMEDQKRWYEIIQPVYGHLKFRLPYTGGNRPSKVTYLYGYLFKQIFPPQTSTESRLVPVGNRLHDWSCQKYQDQMFHHNTVIREKNQYKNPFSKEGSDPIDEPELLNDWDSRAETQILMDYVFKRCGKIDRKTVISLSRLITKKLTIDIGKRYLSLKFLRDNPRYIKEKSMKPSRDNLSPKTVPIRKNGRSFRNFDKKSIKSEKYQKLGL